MKAIILAGGEGTRLQPLSLEKPKPMLRLFDKPLLEHLIILLREHGFTELCITLHYLPEMIRGYFGSGEDWGVSLSYRVEKEPRGTAGSVRDCADFLEGEDFLVISGDAACRLNLRQFWERFRLSGADAAILTQECPDPLEYGLVLTDREGVLRAFLEKPAPGSVVTNLVNTGIYAMSSRLLTEIPAVGTFDFGSQLFPKLLKESRRILTWNDSGYWNDVGTCEAFRQTCRDVLDGRFPLPIPAAGGFPCKQPSWISPDAVIDPSAEIGPYAVIGGGCRIEAGCKIENSILEGCHLQRGAEVRGSILSEQVLLGPEARLESGCVAAEGVRIGAGSFLRAGTLVWPGKRIPEYSILSRSIYRETSLRQWQFSEDSTLSAETGTDITASDMLTLGMAKISGNRIGAACCGGDLAALLAQSFLLGNSSIGKEAFLLDSLSPAAAAFAGYQYGMDLTLFLQQSRNRLKLWFSDRNGLPIARKTQRALEAAWNRGEIANESGSVHVPRFLSGTEESFCTVTEVIAGRIDRVLSVSGSELLKKLLLRRGCRVEAAAEGILQMIVAPDGFLLSSIDELGREWTHEDLLLAYTALECRQNHSGVCLPENSSFLAESVAKANGGSVSRLGQNNPNAASLLHDCPWTRNGILLGFRLICLLEQAGHDCRLCEIMDEIPRRNVKESILKTDQNEISLLKHLSMNETAFPGEGLLIRNPSGTVRIRRKDLHLLQILAESTNAEAASELCAEYRKKLSALDSGQE